MRLTYIGHPFLIDQISKDGKHMDCKEQTGNYGKDLIEEAIEKLWEYENLGEPNTIEALQQENERLEAALRKAREALILSKIHTESCFTTVHKVVDKALAAINKALGGRENE